MVTTAGGVNNEGTLTLTNSTVSGNAADGAGDGIYYVAAWAVSNSLIDGDCAATVSTLTDSQGGNLESPGNTGDFSEVSDQVNVSAGDLNLGALADNGGPTRTHALNPGRFAIDQIPELDCEVDTDQRGQPRPETGGTMCDVGAFEVRP